MMRHRSVLISSSMVLALVVSACESTGPEIRIGEARRLSEQGLTQLEHDDVDTAIRSFQQARVLALQNQDLVEEARALNGLGLCLETQGQFALAIESYERAEALNREADRPEEVLIARLNRANCLAQSGRDADAIELGQDALSDAEDLDYWHRALGHQTLGILCYKTKDYEAAYRELVESRSLFDLAHDEEGEALSDLLSAQLLERSSHYKDALHRFSLAKGKYARLKDANGMAASMAGLARCYEILNQSGIALIWLKKARALGDQLTSTTRREVLRALEQLHEQLGNGPAAADCRRELATVKDDDRGTSTSARRRRQAPPLTPPAAEKSTPTEHWERGGADEPR